MATLRLTGIQKRYESSEQSFTFLIPQLTIDEGEFFALLGPSGSGKTTLLHVIAGLLVPDSGTVCIGESEITHLAPEKRGFSMVFQDPLLFPHMSVAENVAFGLKMQGMKRRERQTKVREILDSVGLRGLEKRLPRELSGGQQQRVSIARAIVTEPSLLLMDEPFSALDPELREEMRELIRDLQRKHGITILFVTHDREEAFLLAHRVGVMKDGKLLQVGKPQELYEYPNSTELAEFLGAKNIIKGIAEGGLFYASGLIIPLHSKLKEAEGPGCLIMRPEIFQVAMESEEIVQDQSHLLGRIEQVSFAGGVYHLKVVVGHYTLDVTEKRKPNFFPETGQAVTLQYHRSQLQWIPGLIKEERVGDIA